MPLLEKDKIILVGNYAADGQTSMLRYAAALSFELRREGHAVETIQPDEVVRRFYRRSDGLGKWLGYVDKYLLFPRRLAKRLRSLRTEAAARTVFHICDHSNSVYLKWLGNVPHLVTCHDMLAIRCARGEIQGRSSRLTGRMLQKRILDGLKRSAHIVCVSEQTRDELARIGGLAPERMKVIYNFLNGDYVPMSPGETGMILHHLFGAQKELAAWAAQAGPLDGYILHVGGNVWYKNRLGVVKIYQNLRRLAPVIPKLLLVGSPFTREMRSYIHDHGLGHCIASIAQCGDRDLNALYAGAKLLLFPSLAEGFGWPIIEAQACGCPVITSNRMPMMEIGGAGALYIPPDNEEEAARIIRRFLEAGESARQERVAAGLKNAAIRFDRKITVRQYLEAYCAA